MANRRHSWAAPNSPGHLPVDPMRPAATAHQAHRNPGPRLEDGPRSPIFQKKIPIKWGLNMCESFSIISRPRLKGALPGGLAEFFARETFLLVSHLHAVHPTHLAGERRNHDPYAPTGTMWIPWIYTHMILDSICICKHTIHCTLCPYI